MDMVGLILIVGGGAYACFIGYMLINHPATMLEIQKRAIEEQHRYEAKAAKAGKRAGGLIAFALRRFFK